MSATVDWQLGVLEATAQGGRTGPRIPINTCCSLAAKKVSKQSTPQLKLHKQNCLSIGLREFFRQCKEVSQPLCSSAFKMPTLRFFIHRRTDHLFEFTLKWLLLVWKTWKQERFTPQPNYLTHEVFKLKIKLLQIDLLNLISTSCVVSNIVSYS